MRGASLHVIQPQSYDGITTLDNSSFMFGEDAGDGLGLFYRHTRFGEDGQEIAVSGSGADHCGSCRGRTGDGTANNSPVNLHLL